MKYVYLQIFGVMLYNGQILDDYIASFQSVSYGTLLFINPIKWLKKKKKSTTKTAMSQKCQLEIKVQ